MAITVTLLCIPVLLSLINGSQGSVIHFQAYPAVLKSNLTESASMRCSLADTEASSNMIGRSVTISSTTDDILHISSIHVTMNDKEVASITPFDPVTAMVDPGNLQVKGQLTGTDSTGYIELSWNNAAAMQLGEYSCEIVAIDSKHQAVGFQSSLELTAVTPTINDVITEFKSKMQEQEQVNQKLAAKMQDQEQVNQRLTAAVDKLKSCTSQRNGFMAVLSTFPQGNGYEDIIPASQPVIFDKVIYSIGGGYDATSGIFTCSQPGIYFFSAHAVSYHNENICIHFKVNNQTVSSLHAWDHDNVDTGSTSAFLHLEAHDTVQLVTAAGCTAEFYSDSNVLQGNVFTGHMTHSDECVV